MPSSPTPGRPGKKGQDLQPDDRKQLGNGERGTAHWPLDLELHPAFEEDAEASRPQPAPHKPAPPPGPPGQDHAQLGNGERGKAHWPLDLELHPDRKDEEEVTRPLNPPPERRSTRRAQDDERSGS